MAETWWIGYILMIIGWGLAGYFHKKARRLSRTVADQAVELVTSKDDSWNKGYRAGHQCGVAYQKEVVRQKIEAILTKSGAKQD